MFTKKNLKNLSKEIDAIFLADPSPNQKAWGLIHDFYHMVITHMEQNGISKADLARRLKKSRSAISKTFNETPNISIKKMVEIADGIECDLKIQLLEKNSYVYKTTSAIATHTLSLPKLWQGFDDIGGIPLAGGQIIISPIDTEEGPHLTVGPTRNDVSVNAVAY